MKKIFSFLMAALFSVGMFATTYTVVGDGCGLSWDQTSSTNDMVADGNVFKLVKEGIELKAGTIQYKIVEDHAWTKSYPQDGNASFKIEKDGKYDVTFTLDLEASPEYSVLAELKEEVVVLPSIAMHGNFTGSWTDTENFTQAENKETASLALTLAAGSYEFGMRIGGPSNWTSNGSAFTRENNSFAIVAGSGNLTLAADVEGEYTFTWTFATNTLAITFPEKGVDPEPVSPIVGTYFATGNEWAEDTESKAEWDAENKKVTVTIALDKVAQWQAQVKYQALASQPDKFYNFSVKLKANHDVSGVTVKWEDNTGLVDESINLVAATEYTLTKEKVQSNVAGNGIIVFDFGFSKAGDIIEIYDVVVEEAAAPTVDLEDGFYIIGLNGWSIYDLTAADKFVPNGEPEGEYVITKALATGKEFKVVAIDADTIAAWFPAEAGNYVVDLGHAGEAKDIYFRPAYDGNENWYEKCIYVAANEVPVNPIDHVYFATGAAWDADNESSAIWEAETGKITVTLALEKVAAWQGQVFVNTVKAEPGKCYNFGVKMKSNKSLSGATIKWQENNNDPIMVSEINTISLVADEEFVYTKEQIAGQEGNGQIVYDFGFAEAGTIIEIYDLVIEETECPAVEHTYTVAGVENVFGSNWNPADENNDMAKQEDGTYKWEKEGLVLAAGNVEFKVCEDHAWAHAWPAQNYNLVIAEAGEYTITITFDPAMEENKVAALATKTGEAQIDPTVSIAGTMNGWDVNADVMTLAENKETASLKLNLDATTYQFKVVLNGSDWRSNAQEFTRENATAAQMTGNEADMSLVADKAGEYTFTWTFETNTLVIEFPATEGIDNTDAAIKAIKYFENGQLIIEKNGVKYNAQGTIIK